MEAEIKKQKLAWLRNSLIQWENKKAEKEIDITFFTIKQITEPDMKTSLEDAEKTLANIKLMIKCVKEKLEEVEAEGEKKSN